MIGVWSLHDTHGVIFASSMLDGHAYDCFFSMLWDDYGFGLLISIVALAATHTLKRVDLVPGYIWAVTEQSVRVSFTFPFVLCADDPRIG
jgi:hypothetical protein